MARSEVFFITAGFALGKTTDLANSRPDLFGLELADHMKRAARHLAGIKTFGEEQPNMENRVELTSAKDEFGMPLGKTDPQLRFLMRWRCGTPISRKD